jgi:competence protein ComFC
MDLEFLWDYIFPKRCIGCGAFGNYLCPSCFTKIQFVQNHICPICERSSIYGATHPGCIGKYCIDGLSSVTYYEGLMKLAIRKFKYKPYLSHLGEVLGLFLANVSHFSIPKGEWIITSVPLHIHKEKERGYNQAEILGNIVAQKLGYSFEKDILLRVKETKIQAKLSEKERKENIVKVFLINPFKEKFIKEKSIIVVDDVWTTGATLRTCTNVLKRGGAKRVWGLTLAR